MSTTHIKSLSVAVESSFGSISATTGLPDISGLTFGSLECDRSPIITYGDPPVNERVEARAGPYNLPPEPDTSGSKVRRSGTFTIEKVHAGIGGGTAFATVDALPDHKLWNAVMKRTVAGAASDAATTGADDNTWDATTPGSYDIGIGVALNIAGRGEYSFVTGIAGDAITVSPALSRTLTGADTARICQTYCVTNTLGGYGDSLAFTADGIGFRTIMVGCRPESVALSLVGKQLKEVWTIRFAHSFDDHDNAAVVDPVVPDGYVAHMLDCYTVVGGTAVNGVSAPAAIARDTIAVDEFSATLSWTLAPKGYSENITGMSDLEVVDFNAEVNIVASAACSSLPQSAFYTKQMHPLLVGFGAVSEGNGLCMYLPAAALQNDPGVRDFGGDYQRYIYNFKQGGPYTGDDSTTAPAGSCFRIAMAN